MNPNFHIVDTVGSVNWAKEDIKKIFKNEPNFLILPTGSCDDNGNYHIYFKIHPLHKQTFLKTLVPKMENACATHGIVGKWEE